jgi:eukaryotic-like serine/threonine-protein kinase
MAKKSAPGFLSVFVNKYFWIGLGVLAVAIFGIYIAFDRVLMPSYTRHEATVQVPDVRERSFTEAARILEQEGLQVEQVVERFNPERPRDIVIDQTPEPNATVKPGRRVFVVVNTGRVPMTNVPSVTDLSIREAENRLRAIGLRVADLLPDTIPSPYPNTVTRQDPAAGDSVAQGANVTLWYSTGLGSDYIEIPDVTNMTVREARERLLDLHLRPIVVGAAEDDEETDEQIVVRQSREPGVQVREGFEIRIFVEEAPERPELQEPELQEF